MTPHALTDIFTHTADPAWLRANGLFVAEGRHVTRRLLATPGYRVVALLLTPTAQAALMDVLEAVPEARRPVVVVRSQAELDALTRFRLHQGCVAFAERLEVPAWDGRMTVAGLSVLLERVRDPDNVGSIARSSAALGARALVIGPECADPYYRKAVRTSMGAVLSMPVLAAEPWPEVLGRMKAQGHVLVATTPDAAAPDVETIGASGVCGPGASVVLLVGSEGEGLTGVALAAADVRVRIPMVGPVDSLNVAVATAVAVYALSRRM